MLATDFISLNSAQFELVAYDRVTLDITDILQVRDILSRVQPDIVLNCAAYTNVDESERAGKRLAFDINTMGVYNLAKVTHELSLDLITISTDYVFDGDNPDGYQVQDTCHPINTYGMSKYLGEQLAHRENPESIIVRTSWLYGG
jgi:dTDP-4-dehydrorhamnose reductase